MMRRHSSTGKSRDRDATAAIPAALTSTSSGRTGRRCRRRRGRARRGVGDVALDRDAPCERCRGLRRGLVVSGSRQATVRAFGSRGVARPRVRCRRRRPTPSATWPANRSIAATVLAPDEVRRPLTATIERLAAQGHLIGDVLAAERRGRRRTSTATRRPARVQAEVGLAGAGRRRRRGRRRACRAAARGATCPRRTRPDPAPARRPARRNTPTKPRSIGALDNGTPVSVMRPGTYTARWVRYYAGWCDKLDGEVLRDGGTGLVVRAARAVRRDRGDPAVERLDDGHGPEGRAGARGRQHRRRQAARDRAVRHAALRRARARGRVCRRACSTSSSATRSRATRSCAIAGVDKITLHRRHRDRAARSWRRRPRTSRRSRSSSAASRPTSSSPTPTSTPRRRWPRCSASAC